MTDIESLGLLMVDDLEKESTIRVFHTFLMQFFVLISLSTMRVALQERIEEMSNPNTESSHLDHQLPSLKFPEDSILSVYTGPYGRQT